LTAESPGTTQLDALKGISTSAKSSTSLMPLNGFFSIADENLNSTTASSTLFDLYTVRSTHNISITATPRRKSHQISTEAIENQQAHAEGFSYSSLL
jgi:hypothetical protein